MSSNKTQPTPIRIDEVLADKIAVASEKTGLPKQDVMRLCMAIGLEDLRKLNYDIAGTLSNAANPMIAAKSALTVLHAAEEPVKYPAKKAAGKEK